MRDAGRSYKRLGSSDLKLLADIAKQDRKEFFSKNPEYAALGDRVLGVALCQGAALHFINGVNGIKDLDVWTFYAEHPALTYPPRRRKQRDFGNRRFGKTLGSPEGYIGRRVDCLGRSIRCDATDGPIKAIRKYLTEGRTQSARVLAKKAVVMIEPKRLLGTVLWPQE